MKGKRFLYLALSTFLGIILSYGIHAVVELMYLNWAEKTNHLLTWTMHFGVGACALSPYVQYGLFIAGVVGGFLIGRVWWRIVYVEHRHWMRKEDRETRPRDV
ncbi:MAG: hypothetical protein V1907_00175 [Candidatus Kerfeldbacteria bacterium]